MTYAFTSMWNGRETWTDAPSAVLAALYEHDVARTHRILPSVWAEQVAPNAGQRLGEPLCKRIAAICLDLLGSHFADDGMLVADGERRMREDPLYDPTAIAMCDSENPVWSVMDIAQQIAEAHLARPIGGELRDGGAVNEPGDMAWLPRLRINIGPEERARYTVRPGRCTYRVAELARLGRWMANVPYVVVQ
jgi:hypothetical protein